MRIGERKDFEQFGTFVIGTFEGEDGPEDQHVRVKSLPLGHESLIEERVPSPRAPYQAAKDPRTGKTQMGPDRRPIMVEDRQDPAYRKKAAQANILQAVATLYHAIDDDQVHFEAQEPGSDARPEQWRDFYQAILEELKAARVPAGRIFAGAAVVAKLMGVDKASVEEAMGAFT